MNKLKELQNFLKDWVNEDSSTECSYIRAKEYKNPDGHIEEVEFDDELYILMQKLGFVNTYVTVGYFESPAYDVTYNCLTVLVDGELHTFPIIFEIF